MWSACFGEEGGYSEFIFENLLSPENILVDFEGGRVRGMLCLEYMDIVDSGNKALPAAYVFGVATDPEHRGKGISSALMERVHAYLPSRGICCSALVPANDSLFDFYGKRGYKTFSYIKKMCITAEEIDGLIDKESSLAPLQCGRIYDIRERAFEKKPYIRWSRRYLEFVIRECRHLDGQALHIADVGSEGYAVCYRDQRRVVIKELAVYPKKVSGFLKALHAIIEADEYVIYLPRDYVSNVNFSAEVLPFSMIKWYDNSKIPAEGSVYLTHALD